MADQYWGRFKTIVVFTAVVGVGHVILVGTLSEHFCVVFLNSYTVQLVACHLCCRVARMELLVVSWRPC